MGSEATKPAEEAVPSTTIEADGAGQGRPRKAWYHWRTEPEGRAGRGILVSTATADLIRRAGVRGRRASKPSEHVPAVGAAPGLLEPSGRSRSIHSARAQKRAECAQAKDDRPIGLHRPSTVFVQSFSLRFDCARSRSQVVAVSSVFVSIARGQVAIFAPLPRSSSLPPPRPPRLGCQNSLELHAC